DSDKGKAVKFYTCVAAGKLDPYYEDVYSLKVRAMRRIAEIYDEAGDIEKAVEWYSKFSEDEDGKICLYNLDKFYSIGEYSVRGIAERLAELYYEIGRKAQSVRYYNKLNFQHDDEIYEDEVVRISCEIAAECKDDTEAAKWYEFSISYGRENDEAAEKISLLAKNGNGYAQCLMAEYFCDRTESLDWYQKAVKNGCCARAYYGIGMIALGGLKDDKEAAKYFYESLKSSAGNYPVNTYRDLYEHSYYSIYSYSFWDTYKGKALEGLLKIVEREQKSPVLPHYAETLVMELISTDSDILEVIKSRYERSNSEHSAIFQNMLGVIYSEDLGGVEVDFEEAASWYRRAAENGHVEAMYALAEMYEEGRGVERDIDEAVKWYREASERGHLTAKTMLDKINNFSETVILEKEPETDTVEDDEDENAENEDNGIEMKQAMKAEAVERMKLLGLPEKIINEFQEKSVIYISESVKYGEISEVYRLDKNDILCIDIKEFEKEYRGSLVYHVIRNFNGENSYGDIDSFLNVFPEPSEWDYVKKVFKTKKILMDVYAFNRTI
ncbi:MAG: sel1 repeat family protein, partial [Synergistaceae bacterium]|nr:sel1 repeat family protein [Synergistaceae bacterium]